MEEKYERIIINIFLVLVFSLSTIFVLQWQQNSIINKHLENIMIYCEKTTGQKQAAYDNDGQFIGCETVIK